LWVQILGVSTYSKQVKNKSCEAGPKGYIRIIFFLFLVMFHFPSSGYIRGKGRWEVEEIGENVVTATFPQRQI